MKNLYNWVFNYNPYTKQWNAVKRENYHKLFNDSRLSEDVLRSSDVTTLVQIIRRTDGNKAKIKTLLS